MTLNWPPTFSASDDFPTHQVSLPYDKLYGFDLWLTPGDLELTSNIFGIWQRLHPPSFASIGQTIRIWPLGDPWWPWIDLQNCRHQNISLPPKFHLHRTNYTDLTPFDLGWPLPDIASLTHSNLVFPCLSRTPSPSLAVVRRKTSEKRDGRTDGLTDGRTDGRTDRRINNRWRLPLLPYLSLICW